MNKKLFAVVLALIVACVPAVAQDGGFAWDPAALQWVSLGLGVAAGIAVDWAVWTFSFGESSAADDTPQLRRLVVHKLPTAAVGITSSVLVMNMYFHFTTSPTDQLGMYLLKGTLLGGVGGLAALFTTYVADAVFGSLAYRDPENPAACNFGYQWALSGITGVISAGLGLVTAGILYIALE